MHPPLSRNVQVTKQYRVKSEAVKTTWVLEPQVFGPGYEAMSNAVREAGHGLVLWDDLWWETGDWPRLSDYSVIFHGSLGNAARVHSDLPWRPGAFCQTRAFYCTAWYPGASQWILNTPWRATTVRELVESTLEVVSCIGSPDSVFVRPDSPLKPFAGRVLPSSAISLDALDFGFYYEDKNLPIVIAPARVVSREWRYVVVSRQVVAGSAYAADGRTALPDQPTGEPWMYATEVASALESPEQVYVMDVCQTEDSLRLLELNPFSGADLYGCDPKAVVEGVSGLAIRRLEA